MVLLCIPPILFVVSNWRVVVSVCSLVRSNRRKLGLDRAPLKVLTFKIFPVWLYTPYCHSVLSGQVQRAKALWVPRQDYRIDFVTEPFSSLAVYFTSVLSGQVQRVKALWVPRQEGSARALQRRDSLLFANRFLICFNLSLYSSSQVRGDKQSRDFEKRNQ